MVVSDHGCGPEAKKKQKEVYFGRGVLKAVRESTQNNRFLKYFKPKEAKKNQGNNKAVQNVAVSLITPIVVKHTNCNYNRSKKSLREFLASITKFKNFKINKNKATHNLKASTTVKKEPNSKDFQSPSSKQKLQSSKLGKYFKKTSFYHRTAQFEQADDGIYKPSKPQPVRFHLLGENEA